jgi:hypothetical protein
MLYLVVIMSEIIKLSYQLQNFAVTSFALFLTGA